MRRRQVEVVSHADEMIDQIRHAMDDAWQQGADCVEVGVVASEQWLIDFYRRLGFEITRENVAMDELPFEVTFLIHEFDD